MNEQLFQIVIAIIPVLGTIITAFIVPYIKAKINSEKLSEYKSWIDAAVNAAEMLYPSQGMGMAKKEYVKMFVEENINKNKVVLTEQQIDILIEACVSELKIMQEAVE